MRTSKILVATALTAAAICLGACSSDGPEIVDLTKPIDLNIGVGSATLTRVTIADDAAFETGNSIGIYMGDPKATAQEDSPLGSGKFNNVQYQYQSSGSSWSGEPIYWQSTSLYHTLYAYSPYNAAPSAANTTLPFELKADQNAASGENYKAADFLWAKTSAMKATSASLTLTLNHKMSLIKVTIIPGKDMTEPELTAMTMAINAPDGGIKALGKFDLKTGNCAAAAEQGSTPPLTGITPYRTGNTFYAIVMPGTQFINAAPFVTLTATDGTPYLYKLNLASGSNLLMESGKKYEFTLKANKAGIDLSQFTIGTWGTGDGDGDGDADMVITP